MCCFVPPLIRRRNAWQELNLNHEYSLHGSSLPQLPAARATLTGARKVRFLKHEVAQVSKKYWI